MKKNNFRLVQLDKGEVCVYDFGNVKLHAYKTNDFLGDEVFLIEKNGKMVVIEQPCFSDNIEEFSQYIKTLNVDVEAKLLSYHMAGGTFLPEVKVYATSNADEYGHAGGGKTLIDNFTGTFGDVFDATVSVVTNIIDAGSMVIAGIKMNIVKTPDAFEIELPEIKAVYTHMLGHDCHSIVAGNGHANAIIAQLKSYIDTGYDLILTSHYTPEDLKDAGTKIAYLEDLSRIAAGCSSSEEFKAVILKKYSDYSGENYLDMTADFFFPGE